MGIFDDLFAEDNDSYGGRAIATKLDSQKASELFISFTRGEIGAAAFDAALEECVVCRGMTAEEIKRYFPPQDAWKGEKDYNRLHLIKAIISEEVRLVGKSRPAANVRNFWYTNLMYTIMKVMGDTNVESIIVGYNTALRELVREGFRYADINLISEKSELCKAIFADSPYPNIILACEKASYHQYLQRLADIFRVTFISLGGQGSYQVFEDLVMQFIQTGIDIDQEFFLYCISDFDPEGYDIEATAKRHLEAAGIAKVTIRRVYIREDQLTKGLVDRAAIPYSWQKSKDSYSRGALTKYNRFGFLTGGIYKLSDVWRRFSKNGTGYEVPQFTDNAQGYELYRLELDNFLPEILAELLIDALEKDIDGAEYYREKVRKFLEPKVKSISYAKSVAEQKANQKVFDIVKGMNELIYAIRDKEGAFDEAYEDVVKELDSLSVSTYDWYSQNINELNSRIEPLQHRIDELQAEIDEIQDQIDDLEEEKESWSETSSGWDRGIDRIHKLIDTLNFKRNESISDIYRKTLSAVVNPVKEYIVQTAEKYANAMLERFGDLLEKIVKKMDFSDDASNVFNAARDAKGTFNAQLKASHEAQAQKYLHEAMSKRRDEILGDETISVDDMEKADEMRSLIKQIWQDLDKLQPAALDERFASIRRGLIKIFSNADKYSNEIEYITNDDKDWEAILKTLEEAGKNG